MTSIKERIVHVSDPMAPVHIPSFLPRIATSDGSEGGQETLHPLANGIDRVLDFPNMPELPPDSFGMHLEVGEDNNNTEVAFPKRWMQLRGAYIFLSNQGEDAAGDAAGGGARRGAKVKCIPLAKSGVEFPPGGRRVFREHAHTRAREGYEMAIHVTQPENDVLKTYVVLDSLGRREAWANAIRFRSDVGAKDTLLRPAGSRFDRAPAAGRPSSGNSNSNITPGAGGLRSKGKLWAKVGGNVARINGDLADDGADKADPELNEALRQFGQPSFHEEKYLNTFLTSHAESEIQGECEKLDKWMGVMKGGLRRGVLEQYKYFVEASREMSTMGREVGRLRTLVERQQEMLMGMKNLDFGMAFGEEEEDEEEYEHEHEHEHELNGHEGGGGGDHNDVDDDDSAASFDSDDLTSRGGQQNRRRRGAQSSARPGSKPSQPSHPPFEIPPWINDVTEEVSSFINESRYTDATDLILKAKVEVNDILSAHEMAMGGGTRGATVPSPPPPPPPRSSRGGTDKVAAAAAAIKTDATASSAAARRLTQKQLAFVQRTLRQINALVERMGRRLAEGLRRKNEALKASAKRERADPLSKLSPLVSPVCLNDDAVALNLLVKLGRPQDAATAYAARRSLLLSECLHERPISSPVGMDSVIFAAQLSSSFFSSLAMAVEGFLDLFIDSDNGKIHDQDDDTSLTSRSVVLGGKRVPSGALSAIVLWCDSELAKFSNVFGSPRLLGNLSLSPPGIVRGVRQDAKSEGKGSSQAKDRDVRLSGCALPVFSAVLRHACGGVGGVRKTIGGCLTPSFCSSHCPFQPQYAIEVAAKCVDQAFSFASENLDSIGLPLTPKLAENIRPKLKGCDPDIATLLGARWRGVVFDWTTGNSTTFERKARRRNSTNMRPVSSDNRRV